MGPTRAAANSDAGEEEEDIPSGEGHSCGIGS
jgi:hypothetical protein